MVVLAGYTLTDTLREAPGLVVYRGSRADGTPVIAIVAREQAAQALRDRLESEFSLRAELDPAWALVPLELLPQAGSLALILADAGGLPLDVVVTGPVPVAEFLYAAIAIAGALDGVHQRGLIHKDLKPGNIFWNTTTGQARITGFGLATRLPREQQTSEPATTLLGTLAYMAPERTGRMNRSVDSRSDLYSLGVTFYQLLSGTLPFSALGAADWVHSHVARAPMPLSERAPYVPEQLSRLVMKLLAKAAEDRYQTAAGLRSDLQRCLADWEARGQIGLFALAQKDAADRLLIPEKLYGRELEVKTLLEAFSRVVTSGDPELLLVSGYSGVGKSSLVGELGRALVVA
ncbi:MAG TPA: serine/threonine-protein kinase, partial [Polyangiaceae bacterium]|nr:serine/threonine-protein kinase [Polyangiaceae bacterium]